MTEAQRTAGLLHDVFHGELLSHQPGEAWHGPALLGLVEDLSAEDAARKPIAGAHSIWELVAHIANWNEITARRLAGEAVEGVIDSEEDWPRPAGKDAAWRQTLTRLRESYERLHAALEETSDERLAQTAVARNFANYVMVHGIIHHVVYHSGQVALLRRALAHTR